MQVVEYGIGGYDPAKPNNNVVNTITIPDTPQSIAVAAQDTSVANLLSGAAALLVRLQDIQNDIAAKNTTYQTAKTTYQTALAGLAASPTTAQISTFLKNTQATYLLADNAALTAIGTDLNGAITELENVVRGLGNLVARQSGSTATF